MGTEEVEAKALSMGWIPKEQFKGDEARWVDAETFVRRGEEFLPILKANNKKLESELSSVKGELVKTNTLLKAANEAIETLKEFNTQRNREAVEAKAAQLKERLKEARQEGDVDAEEQIREQLDETRDALKDAKAKPETKPSETSPPVDYTQRPEWQQFVQENPWWNENRRMRAMAVEIAAELREDPEGKSLAPTDFFRRVAEETKKLFDPKARPVSKVEASRGGAGGGSDAQGYGDLPADAKSACDRMAARLVGEGRAYKNLKEWREAYAAQYYRS